MVVKRKIQVVNNINIRIYNMLILYIMKIKDDKL